MSVSISSEVGAYRCHGCGRVVGSIENGVVAIRHKGRTVRVKPLCGACEIHIVCDKPSCKATNVLVISDPKQDNVVESLDKTRVSKT